MRTAPRRILKEKYLTRKGKKLMALATTKEEKAVDVVKKGRTKPSAAAKKPAAKKPAAMKTETVKKTTTTKKKSS